MPWGPRVKNQQPRGSRWTPAKFQGKAPTLTTAWDPPLPKSPLSRSSPTSTTQMMPATSTTTRHPPRHSRRNSRSSTTKFAKFTLSSNKKHRPASSWIKGWLRLTNCRLSKCLISWSFCTLKSRTWRSRTPKGTWNPGHSHAMPRWEGPSGSCRTPNWTTSWLTRPKWRIISWSSSWKILREKGTLSRTPPSSLNCSSGRIRITCNQN